MTSPFLVSTIITRLFEEQQHFLLPFSSFIRICPILGYDMEIAMILLNIVRPVSRNILFMFILFYVHGNGPMGEGNVSTHITGNSKADGQIVYISNLELL